ncbi:hypothetical protein [Cohnella sp. WQ 127256]|uniref:hypothetical protein n=1 Tax=Cohnella sp. WQ 127256 TaxID=2938790 RepID=UPI0021176CFA|nr:hypothetical protein [Cohnella sp. WQ 127256]
MNRNEYLLCFSREFKRQLIGIVIAVLMFGLIHTFFMRRREGRWEHTGLFVDFVKVIFYGLLAYLTLYLQYDESTKMFSLSLINRKLSLGEMLVILLAALEVVAKVVNIIIRFENILKSNSKHIERVFENINKDQEQDKQKNQVEMERAKLKKVEEQKYKDSLTAIRVERLNKIKQKKFKYN